MGLTGTEIGQEQFTVETLVDDERIDIRPICDPFIRTTILLRGLRHAWNALFYGIRVEVRVDGSPGAERAVLALDSGDLARDTDLFLAEMAHRRAENQAAGIIGYRVMRPD